MWQKTDECARNFVFFSFKCIMGSRPISPIWLSLCNCPAEAHTQGILDFPTISPEDANELIREVVESFPDGRIRENLHRLLGDLVTIAVESIYIEDCESEKNRLSALHEIQHLVVLETSKIIVDGRRIRPAVEKYIESQLTNSSLKSLYSEATSELWEFIQSRIALDIAARTFDFSKPLEEYVLGISYISNSRSNSCDYFLSNRADCSFPVE